MKREDLVKLYRRRLRPQSFFMLFVFLLFLVGFGLAMNGTLAKVDARWSKGFVIPVLAGGVMVVAVLVAIRSLAAVPKCPHCGARLTAWLLHIAIASGNCGYCGKSIES